jgi:DNA polymerase-3 subunit epsilon
MRKFLWLDCETTGLDPKINDIHQIAGQMVIDGITVDEFDLKFQPNNWDTVQPEALAVSGLTIDDLRARTMTSKAAYKELNTRMCKRVNKYDNTDKFVFCAYNANFDAQFTNEWFNKHGNKYFFGLCHGGAYFDPLNLALLVEMKAGKKLFMPNRKLATVAAYYGVVLDNAHDALADIRATREVGKILWSVLMGDR